MGVRWIPILVAPVLLGCGTGGPPPSSGPARQVIRVGHFPNVTHAHGLVAHALSRQGKGWFEQRLGAPVELQWFVYNAGPSAMEAMLAGSLDLTYVGPNPALNAYLRSGGAEVRVVAGATTGGAALVVRPDGGIGAAADFRGRRIATPQLGNTQDIACRAWLAGQGFTVTQTGGDVTVLPTQNPDQLTLFKSGALDACWTVEPWVSRLELEAGARVFLEEPDAVTTLLAARAGFLAEHAGLAERFVRAHAELTAWLNANPEPARELVRGEIKAETAAEVSATVLERAWGRMRFADRVPRAELNSFVVAARGAGFAVEELPLDRLFEVPWERPEP